MGPAFRDGPEIRDEAVPTWDLLATGRLYELRMIVTSSVETAGYMSPL